MSLFPVILHIEESRLGQVLRKVNGMEGVAKIDLDLNPQPKAAPQQRQQQRVGPSANDVIVKHLLDTGLQRFSEIERALKAHGFVPSSGMVKRLLNNGIIESPSKGTYRLNKEAEKKLRAQIASLSGDTPALPSPTPAKPRKNSRDAIRDVLADGPKNYEEIKKAYTENGRQTNGVYEAISFMRKKKIIRAVPGAEGTFELIPPKK